MIENIMLVLMAAFAVEAIVEIIVASKLTANVLKRLKKRANPIIIDGCTACADDNRLSFFKFLDGLLNCGYCVSVWIAGFFALFLPPLFDTYSIWLLTHLTNWLLTTAILHRLSNWLHVIFMRMKNGRVQTVDIHLSQQ